MGDDIVEIDEAAIAWSEPQETLRERPLVLLLHGRGSHELDLLSLVPHLVPGAVYASLRAPHPFPGGNGYTWFPPAEPGLPDPAAVLAATRGILAWLDRVSPVGRVASVGFSQGGALTTHLMRTEPERFAAFVNLSGFAVRGEAPADDRLAELRPRMFWGRDAADPVITAGAIDFTEQWLPGHSTLRAELYPGVGHGISADEIVDVREFLAATLFPAGGA
ncbi:phospholipase/carboxylesterase [Homoserinimonas aerilata]|uniref:Phospholipase/carboxylesterase n=1 Tax=Homoserinimonas aerilata TaxID=1162970 RepID=A0A542YJY6_9MICO|nr:dienelactone hydrolase family protein [Homoserinimonas aerilata]TQL48426.1 phospholipase/carboxylesterase [Homoserinimonas aerilata]